MPDNSVIQILLKFLTDRKSQKEAQDAVKQVGQSAEQLKGKIDKSLKGAGAPAQVFGGDLKQLAQDTKDFASTAGISLEQAAESFSFSSGISKEAILEQIGSLGKLEDTTKRTTQSVIQQASLLGQAFLLKAAGFGISRIGTDLERLGQFVFKQADDYAKAVGLGSQASQDWLDAVDRIDQAHLRIGRTITEQVTPLYEKIADLMEQAAEFAEQNPEVVRNVVTIATAAIVLGAALKGIGAALGGAGSFLLMIRLLKVLSSGGLAAATGGAAAAGGGTAGGLLARVGAGITGGVASIGGLTGAIVAAIGIGFQTLLAKGAFGVGGRIGEALGIPSVDWARQIGEALGGEEFGRTIANFVAKLLGQFDKIEPSAEAAAGALNKVDDSLEGIGQRIIPQEALQAFDQLQRDIVQAEQDYGSKRAAIVKEFSQRIVDETASYEARRADIIKNSNAALVSATQSYFISLERATRDFTTSQRRAEEDYLRRRRDITKDYGKEAIRRERDLQRRLLKLREDHEERLEDFIAARDALGIVREMRRYERQRRDEEENFREQQEQRKDDLKERLKELEEQYAIERHRRIEDFATRRADEQADFQRRMTELRQQRKDELAELKLKHDERLAEIASEREEELKILEEGHKKLIESLQKNFIERIRAIDARLLGDYRAYQQHLLAISEQFKRALQTYVSKLSPYIARQSSGPSGGRQFGGYVGPGIWKMGEGGEEFVLSNRTTRLAERLTGGRLNQQRLIQAMAGGKQQVTVQQSGWRFQGGMSEAERRWYRRTASEEAKRALTAVLEKG